MNVKTAILAVCQNPLSARQKMPKIKDNAL